jgi:hypothetical protein
MGLGKTYQNSENSKDKRRQIGMTERNQNSKQVPCNRADDAGKRFLTLAGHGAASRQATEDAEDNVSKTKKLRQYDHKRIEQTQNA